MSFLISISNSNFHPITGRKSETTIPRYIVVSLVSKTIGGSRYEYKTFTKCHNTLRHGILCAQLHGRTAAITQRHAKLPQRSHKDTQNYRSDHTKTRKITAAITQRHAKLPQRSHKDTQNYRSDHTKTRKITAATTQRHAKLPQRSHKDTQNYRSDHTKTRKVTAAITQRHAKLPSVEWRR